MPVYPNLGGVEYIVLWYVGWCLLKRMQSGSAQLCEHEKCLHPFCINVSVALNGLNLDSLHLLNEVLSSLFFLYGQSFPLHVISLKFLVTMAEKNMPICEQIGECKVHIMQKDSGRVVGVAVSLCPLEIISHAEKLVQFCMIAMHAIKLMPETGID